jgi:pimeloyl-ACP methyl ester carboxylesterase
MPAQATSSEFDLQLRSGRVRVRRVGSPTAPLVLFIHGLSAHLHSFDYLIEQLAGRDLQLVAVDLRGRGRSEITPAGSYGLHAHCRDVLDIATLLGAQEFDLVGWSMGALIGIAVAALAQVQATPRLKRLVLIDHAGAMDAGPTEKIGKGLERLDLVMDRPETYLDAIRLGGSINPWSPFWDNYYRYELQAVAQGVTPSTSRQACQEDLISLRTEDFHALWPKISVPALLIRATVPIADGFIVPERERDAIKQAVPQLQIAELPVDHYTVMVSSDTARVLDQFIVP